VQWQSTRSISLRILTMQFVNCACVLSRKADNDISLTQSWCFRGAPGVDGYRHDPEKTESSHLCTRRRVGETIDTARPMHNSVFSKSGVESDSSCSPTSVRTEKRDAFN